MSTGVAFLKYILNHIVLSHQIMQDITSKTFFYLKWKYFIFLRMQQKYLHTAKFQAVKSAVLLAKEAITKYHELSGSNKGNFFVSQFWRPKCETNVLPRLVSPEESGRVVLSMPLLGLC